MGGGFEDDYDDEYGGDDDGDDDDVVGVSECGFDCAGLLLVVGDIGNECVGWRW